MNIRTLSSAVALGTLALASIYSFLPAAVPHAAAQGSTQITGFAWSDTIGWISFSCSDLDTCGTSNYGIGIGADGTFSGYAWSEHIGWISANASDLSGCPSSPCTARIEGAALKGWMRALAGSADGWDGWISLSASNYGPTLSDGMFTGYAWGDTVVGWVSFSTAFGSVRTSYMPCTPSTTYSCSDQTIVETVIDGYCAETVTNPYATCSGAAFCASGSATCLVPSPSFIANAGNRTTGHLQVRPLVVNYGTPVQLYWNVSNVDSCTVSGSNEDFWDAVTSSASGTTTSGITGRTTFTLRCDAYEGAYPPSIDESVTVGVTPRWDEPAR